LDNAIDNAVANGVVFIAAAGNNGGTVNSPGNCANAIPVGATNSNDSLASFSSRGAELANNGVVAPGVGIITTDLGGKLTAPSDAAIGTSFSAPIVSGLAALLLAQDAALTVAQVKAHIRNGAETIGEVANNQGAGRVNACRSMKLLLAQAADQCVSGASNLAGFAKAEKVVAFPNPLRTTDVGGAVIKIPSDMQATSPKVRIYTLDGVLVKTVTPAANAAVWDGKNENGKPVASGVYLVAVGSGSGVRRTKLAVIR
jgi:subtilisin family serine protease